MIQGHTGRGINYACDCEFCEAKRLHTSYIGNARYLMRTATPDNRLSSLRPYMLDPDYIENWIWLLRRAARRKAREQFQQLKEK